MYKDDFTVETNLDSEYSSQDPALSWPPDNELYTWYPAYWSRLKIRLSRDAWIALVKQALDKIKYVEIRDDLYGGLLGPDVRSGEDAGAALSLACTGYDPDSPVLDFAIPTRDGVGMLPLDLDYEVLMRNVGCHMGRLASVVRKLEGTEFTIFCCADPNYNQVRAVSRRKDGTYELLTGRLFFCVKDKQESFGYRGVTDEEWTLLAKHFRRIVIPTTEVTPEGETKYVFHVHWAVCDLRRVDE